MSISKSSDLVIVLKNMSDQMTLDQIEQASSGIFASIANSLIVKINFNLNKIKLWFLNDSNVFISNH